MSRLFLHTAMKRLNTKKRLIQKHHQIFKPDKGGRPRVLVPCPPRLSVLNGTNWFSIWKAQVIQQTATIRVWSLRSSTTAALLRHQHPLPGAATGGGWEGAGAVEQEVLKGGKATLGDGRWRQCRSLWPPTREGFWAYCCKGLRATERKQVLKQEAWWWS